MPLWLDLLKTPMAAPETAELRGMRRTFQFLCVASAVDLGDRLGGDRGRDGGWDHGNAPFWRALGPPFPIPLPFAASCTDDGA